MDLALAVLVSVGLWVVTMLDDKVALLIVIMLEDGDALVMILEEEGVLVTILEELGELPNPGGAVCPLIFMS